MAIEITSDDLIPIDTCFRLKAGPGAGKTYWLIKHVKNVIENADLGKRGRVACITYSNVGVDTIQNRLGKSSKVDILTIHSFLYGNIVKPYFHLIAANFGFSLERFSGVPDDYIMDDYPTLQAAKTASETRHIDFSCWSSYLKSLKWTFNGEELECKSTRPIIKSKNGPYLGSSQLGQAYKALAWGNGIMHYDDVLYFSYMLIKSYPWIAKMLAVVYPFVFVDEYQDTNPIQSKILECIGLQGAIVGIIGDVAQSIYGFIGATPKNFIDFSHPNLQEYEITKNRRSLSPIINFLNRLRSDLVQIPLRTDIGEPVRFLIGGQDEAFTYVQETLQLDTLVLSYTNIETNSLRYKYLEKRGEAIAVKIDENPDSIRERKKIVTYLIRAIAHARQAKFKNSFNNIENIGIDSRVALNALRSLLSDEKLDDTMLSELINKLRTWGIDIAQLKNGKAKTFYDTHTFGEVVQSISIDDDNGQQRTIHKAKGDEADNVLVLMGNSFNPKTFFNFKLLSNGDSNRVYYVAMSRARDRLFVNLPELPVDLEQRFVKEWGIEVVRL